MSIQKRLHVNSFQAPPGGSSLYGAGGSPFPGVGSPYPTLYQGGNSQVPYGSAPQIEPVASSSGFSFKDIKGFVDKMGGVEGIMNTMQKVQKFATSVQQMTPMIKLIAGLIPSKARALTTDADNYNDYPIRRRRRRRRRRKLRRAPKKNYSTNRSRYPRNQKSTAKNRRGGTTNRRGIASRTRK